MKTMGNNAIIPTRFGIVGCGAVTREYHLPAIRTLQDVQVAALCDRNVRSARLIQKEFQLDSARIVDAYSSLAGQVDAVLVAVPPKLHAPVAIALMEAGMDVLCEKPLATSLSEAQKIIATAQTNNRILAVGLQMRFHPNNQLLREVVADGWLGDIQEVVGEFGAVNNWNMTGPSYYSREFTGGGVFFDMGVHLVDCVVWLFGNLTDLEYADDSYGGVESNAFFGGKLQIESRPVRCRMEFSWTHDLKNSLRVIGTEATAEVSLHDNQTVSIRKILNGKTVEMQLCASNSANNLCNPYQMQIADFVDAVRNRREPFVTAASSLPALQLIEQAYAIRRRLTQPWMET